MSLNNSFQFINFSTPGVYKSDMDTDFYFNFDPVKFNEIRIAVKLYIYIYIYIYINTYTQTGVIFVSNEVS